VNGTPASWFGGWILLAIVLVVANDQPSLAPIVRYTLIAVILYVLLTNIERFRPLVDSWIASIGGRPAVGSGGGGGGRIARA
jgi:hypothetical protein